MSVQESFDKFAKESKRVLRVARKPDGEEYTNFAKVTGIGIILIGLIGFIIVLIGQLIGI